MSVRAYIVRENYIWVDEINRTYYDNNDGNNLIEYVHTDKEYCFNVWSQAELLELLFKYGAEDYTNHDFVGTIEIGKEEFESMIENTKKEWSQDDWESINLIQKYFEEGYNWLVLNCY